MQVFDGRASLFLALSALALFLPLAGARAQAGSSAAGSSQAGAAQTGAAPLGAAQIQGAELEQALAKEGLLLDREAGVLSAPAAVQIKNELLEYLLVGPGGALHESLFVTSVRPSLLNAALLLCGVEPGRNAHWEERAGVDERGRPNKQVYPPEGDGFYLYVAWREAGELYFFRAEDLVRNLQSGRSLRRHRWVYLGSRFVRLKPDQPESFLADVEGNLINLSFFFQGNTLLTSALDECFEQTIWAANEWLLPERGQPVRLFFARAPLERLEPAWLASLPEAKAVNTEAGTDR